MLCLLIWLEKDVRSPFVVVDVFFFTGLTRMSSMMVIFILPLLLMVSSILLCTHTTLSVCILKTRKLENRFLSGGNHLWLCCNCFSLLLWCHRAYTLSFLVVNHFLSESLRHTLFIYCHFSFCLRNSSLHLTCNLRNRRLPNFRKEK